MAFFIGIAGPWIVLMALDLFWTRQGLEGPRPGSWQGRLEHLLRRREGRLVPIPSRSRAADAPVSGQPPAGLRELGTAP